MPCSACQRRKKALLAKLAAKKAKGKTVQAAAISAVLTTTGLVGKLIEGDAPVRHAYTERAAEDIDADMFRLQIGEKDEGPDSRQDASGSEAGVGSPEG